VFCFIVVISIENVESVIINDNTAAVCEIIDGTDINSMECDDVVRDALNCNAITYNVLPLDVFITCCTVVLSRVVRACWF